RSWMFGNVARMRRSARAIHVSTFVSSVGTSSPSHESITSSAVAHAMRYPSRSGLWSFQCFHAGDKVVESRLVGLRVHLRSRRIVTGCLLAVEGGLQPGHITNRMIVIGVGERGRFTRHAPPRRRALRSIHVAPQLNQSGLNLVMVVRVP